MFTTYADVRTHLDHLGLFHMDFSLQRMHTALHKLHLTQTNCPLVQVLGTNGKGSTAAFLAAISQAHNLKTGLYTSPHFLSPTERIRINGIPLEPSLWPALGNTVMDAQENLTYFEFLTVLTMLAFREASVDLIIMEAGLGGAHDATTAICADMLCYTPIGMDHMAILGDSLTAIASDKAQAIRSKAPIVSAPQEQEALACLKRSCTRWQAPLTLVAAGDVHAMAHLKLGLAGPHQCTNAAVARAGWRVLHEAGHVPYSTSAVQQGLACAFVPGRLQQCKARWSLPALWLDGAHNEHGMRALVTALQDAALQPSAVIFSCLQDKDWQGMCRLLLTCIEKQTPLLIPSIHNERALDAHALAASLRELGATDVRPVADISMAISLLDTISKHEPPALICGSLYLLAEFYTLFPQYLQRRPFSDGESV